MGAYLVRTDNDGFAHIPQHSLKPLTKCGQPINLVLSTKHCELCDKCLYAASTTKEEEAE
jgi:hypothetical protein